MADRISGGGTQAVQQRQPQEADKATDKSSPSQAFKGRGVEKDGASPVRQSSSPPSIKQAGGKSWKERAAKLDGATTRSKPSTANARVASQTVAKGAAQAVPQAATQGVTKGVTKGFSKTASLPPTSRPPMPAPYSGPRTLQRGAPLSRSNFNDVRRGKFKEQFQQRTQDYDRRSAELSPFQKKVYHDYKNTIASLLKQNPGDTEGANKQFGELTNLARMVDDMFHGDSSYLAKLTIGDW